jgi:hypothetical protein
MKNDVLKRWEISSLALSLALPSIAPQSPHQILLGGQRREWRRFLNAQEWRQVSSCQRELTWRGWRGIYTLALKNSRWLVKFRRLRTPPQQTPEMCGDSAYVRTPDTPQKPHVRRLRKLRTFLQEHSKQNIPCVVWCKGVSHRFVRSSWAYFST